MPHVPSKIVRPTVESTNFLVEIGAPGLSSARSASCIEAREVPPMHAPRSIVTALVAIAVAGLWSAPVAGQYVAVPTFPIGDAGEWHVVTSDVTVGTDGSLVAFWKQRFFAEKG